MTCPQIQNRLPDYSVENLPARQREEIASHLETCPACAAEWRRLQASWRLLERTAVPEPPPGMWRAVEARIAARRVRRPFWVRGMDWWKQGPWAWLRARPAPAVAMGLAVLLLVVGSFLWRGPTEKADWAPPPLRPMPMAPTHSYFQQYAVGASYEPLADRAALGVVATLAQREGSGP